MIEIRLPIDADVAPPVVVEHELVEFIYPAQAGAWLELTVGGLVVEPFLRPGELLWRWRWNPGAAVGSHEVMLDERGGEKRVWQLRVAPRKIDQEHYQRLLNDIQRSARSLAYSLSGASSEGAALLRDHRPANEQLDAYYAIFEGQLEGFVRAVRRIGSRPREQLRRGDETIPFGRASNLDSDALARVARGTFDETPAGVADELQTALRPEGGLLPRNVVVARARASYDTYEHRLLKHLLVLLTRRARHIGDLAEHEQRRALSSASSTGSNTRLARLGQIVQGCADAIGALRELAGLAFLADVQPLSAFRGATPLLQRDPQYREIYRMWQALRQETFLSFDSPLFSIPIADLPRLYESWCALQIAEALLSLGGEVREQRLITAQPAEDERALFVSLNLVEDVPLLVLAQEDTVLCLRYQPRYRPSRSRSRLPSEVYSLDRHTRVPDLAIEILRDGQPPQVLVFDAKYRLDADGRGVPQDALADAYAYLGAIGYTGARATRGALLLYPGAHDEQYPSGVGAIALLPGMTEKLNDTLQALL